MDVSERRVTHPLIKYFWALVLLSSPTMNNRLKIRRFGAHAGEVTHRDDRRVRPSLARLVTEISIKFFKSLK